MERKIIAIIDYGAGNLRSVINAFEAIGQRPFVTDKPAELAKAAAIVLPGFGAFGDGMRNLRQRGWVEALNEEVRVKGKPYLGICLGLQFLARTSLERGIHEGLNWIDSEVVEIEPNGSGFRVPHIGWNEVRFERASPIFDNLEDGPVFYFVHSYYLRMDSSDREAVTATCWHGVTITAAVQKENLFGVQFHPEKSQRSGLSVLRNFAQMI